MKQLWLNFGVPNNQMSLHVPDNWYFNALLKSAKRLFKPNLWAIVRDMRIEYNLVVGGYIVNQISIAQVAKLSSFMFANWASWSHIKLPSWQVENFLGCQAANLFSLQ